MPDLHRPDRVRVQDRPVHLLRRPQQAALQEVDLGRRPGVERILAPGVAEPLRRGRRGLPGRPGGCRAPGRRAPGWPARAAGAAHAGAGVRPAPGRAGRRAPPGPPRGTRSPLGPLRRDSRRRPPKPALGGRLRAPRGAVRSGGDERASPPACRGGPVEAGGSPIPGTGVRAGSGPDNDGTHQYCQMVRARLARRRGIRRGTSG